LVGFQQLFEAREGQEDSLLSNGLLSLEDRSTQESDWSMLHDHMREKRREAVRDIH